MGHGSNQGSGQVRKQVIAQGTSGRVIIMDSITMLVPEDAGAIVVCASHGGSSSARFALELPLAAVFFNDAGVGKDDAGIVALDMLQAVGTAAGTVAHTTARIGDARDTWDSGIISFLNPAARSLGLAPGTALYPALIQLISR
jgi:thiazole synthase ThiGH ThiG subunit